MMTYSEKKARLLAYTRRASSEDYPNGLAYSIHFAYSMDGVDYRALHQNYGVLFAEAEISAEDTIVPKCVKLPRLFQISEGEYGILADRTEEDGSPEMTDIQSDEDSNAAVGGYALFWKTQDFTAFSKQVLVEKKGE